MINFRNVKFVKSATTYDLGEKTLNKEILICGRSNVGKSSLINALCDNKNLAYTSSKPGHTRLLNYFNVDNAFYLIDAPGYGYARGGIDLDKLFLKMMDSVFKDVSRLKGVLLLLDSRRTLNDDDISLIDFILSKNIPFLIVATKKDKLNQSEMAYFKKHLNEMQIPAKAIIFISTNNKTSLINLSKQIELLLK